MAATPQKATPVSCCSTNKAKPSDGSCIGESVAVRSAPVSSPSPTNWGVVPTITAGGAADPAGDPIGLQQRAAVVPVTSSSLIRPVESLPDTTPSGKPIMSRAHSNHPLDPLSANEIKVAIATVRAAGATPEERDSMRFVEVVLLEPDKQVVAIADAYFFPPFQPSLVPRTKRQPGIPSKLPPRQARLIVYNKRSNETSVWIVQLTEAHATTRGGHHRGKIISTKVIPDVQPPM